MKLSFIVGVVICVIFLGGIVPAESANQIIKVQKLDSAPTVDGNAEEWKQGQAVNIPLSGKLGNKEISVQAGVFGDSVYFLWQWMDTTEDIMHKPFIWDEKFGKYKAGPQKEDRLAVTFAMEGDFTSDWMSGQTFKADMWHWKSARSNPIGLAHDKMTIVAKEPSKGAYKAIAKDNSYIYILRPSDEGDKLYSTKRYPIKDKDLMPKYILEVNPKGSIADVQAKGVWSNDTWTLEEKRLLDTGHADDVIFKPGTAVPSAIAVFNHSENEKHNISETIVFKFPK